MYQQTSLFTGWSCEGCKSTNSQFLSECSSCKTPRSSTQTLTGKLFGGFGGNHAVLGSSSQKPSIQASENKFSSLASSAFPPAPTTGGVASGIYTPPQNTTYIPQKCFELIATTNIPNVKNVKTMGLLVCSAVAGKVDKIETVKESGPSFDLFKSVIKGEEKPKGRLTTIAPLAMIKIEKTALKDILGKDTTDDEIDTCDVYLNLLRRLVNETLVTKDDIINYVLHEASLAQNKRLFFTVKFAATNPVVILQSIRHTEIDVINVFTVALMYFVHFDNKPLEALAVVERENQYFPKEVSQVLAGMIGSSYGYKWIPDAWTTVAPYQSILDLTKFFSTIGTSKLI